MLSCHLLWAVTGLENCKKELGHGIFCLSQEASLRPVYQMWNPWKNVAITRKLSSLIGLETGNSDFNKQLIPASPAHSGNLLVKYLEKAVQMFQYLSCTESRLWRQMLSPQRRHVNHQSRSERRPFVHPDLDFTPQLSFLKEVIWTIIIMNNGCKHFSVMIRFYLQCQMKYCRLHQPCHQQDTSLSCFPETDKGSREELRLLDINLPWSM